MFWPAVLILLGITHIVRRRHGRKIQLGVFLIILGGIFQIYKLNLLPYDTSPFSLAIPVLLIWAGISIFSKVRNPRRRPCNEAHDTDCFGKTENFESFDDSPEVNVFFSSVTTMNKSTNFNSGHVTVAFGEARIDLRDATLAEKPDILELSVVLGSCEIMVPKDWNILIKPKAVLGSVDNFSRNKFELEGNFLVIKADTVLGAIKILN
jgi:predicted membrane protein